MKTILVAILILVLASPVFAGSWDDKNTSLQIPLTILMVVDYGQTLYIADHPEEYMETNSAMGPHPSRQEVTEYFALYYLAVTGITWALPAKWSHWYQRGIITMEIYNTVGNHFIGVGFTF